MAEPELVLCMPCQSTDEPLTLPAVKFCINCNEPLCKSCIETHRKFGPLKSHKLIDCSTHDTRHLKGAKQLSTYMTCPDHDDSMVKLLCEEHNALCCLTCASTTHRNCRTVSEIKKIAAGCKTSGRIDKTRTRLEEAGACMQEIINVNAACRAEFEDSKEEIPRKLEEIKMKMLKIFERMESAVRERVKTLHIDEDIAMGNREENWKLRLDANIELLEMLDAVTEVGTESQVFVALHRMKDALLETENALSEQGNQIKGQRLNLESKDKLESFMQTDVIDNLVTVQCIQNQYQLPKTTVYSKRGGDTEYIIVASDSLHGSRAESPWSTSSKGEYTTKEGIKVFVYKHDILKLNVDCIVNATNKEMEHGGGVARVIARAAGYQLEKECREYVRAFEYLNVGKCYSTTAGKLNYKCVIHTVGPDIKDYRKYDYPQMRRELRQAVRVCFEEAERQNCSSIGVTSISSGVYGVPKSWCAEEYARAVTDYSRNTNRSALLREIHFVDINDEMLDKIKKAFRAVLDTVSI